MELALNSKLTKQSLAAQLAEKLVEEITSGACSPTGMLPSEQALAAKYGVSRPVVREALTQLSALGFVEIKNGVGAVIREINGETLKVFFRRLLLAGSRQDIIDIFEIREILESLSVIKAAAKCGKLEIAELKKTVTQMRQSIEVPITYTQLDVQFHTQIALFSKNLSLFHFISSIRHTLISVNNTLRSELGPGERLAIQENHEQIFEAISRRDLISARKAMDAHFENLMGRLTRTLSGDTAQ